MIDFLLNTSAAWAKAHFPVALLMGFFFGALGALTYQVSANFIARRTPTYDFSEAVYIGGIMGMAFIVYVATRKI